MGKSRQSMSTKYDEFINQTQRGGMNVHRGRLWPQRGRGIGNLAATVARGITRLLPKATTAMSRIGKNSGFVGNLVAKKGVRQLKKAALSSAKKKVQDLVNKGIAKGVNLAEKKLNTKIDRKKVSKAQSIMRGILCEKKKKKKKGQAGGGRRKKKRGRTTTKHKDRF